MGRGRGVTKNQNRVGNYLKREVWTVCRFRGSLAKKRGGERWGVWGRVDIPVHNMALWG